MDTELLAHFGSCEYAAMNTSVEIAETLHPVLLGLCPEVGLLDDMGVVYLKICSSFPQQLHYCMSSQAMQKGSNFCILANSIFFFKMIILMGVKRFKNFFFTKKRVARHQSEEHPLFV